MKKTNYFILAAAAALFAACSSDDGLAPEKQPTAQTEQMPVAFGAYVNRGTTRAGAPGTLTTNNTTASEISMAEKGFGVFAYYTDGAPYSETSTPNFMYNQKVTGSGTTTITWGYSPVKYWPNEFGGAAQSDDRDLLTFFAYAPYVDVIPGTGRIDQSTGKNSDGNSLTSGIVGMTSNVATGDPYIKYYADFNPGNCVDLCYGVAASDFKDAATVTGASPKNNVAAGNPYIDVVKPNIADKINFTFKHALAAINVQIDADVDVSDHPTTHPEFADKNTRIWVRSVTFEGFTDKGALNLNSSTEPQWYELSNTNTAIGSGSVTICDGRRDGKEGQTNATATNEATGLNVKLIQDAPYKWDASDGLQLDGSTNSAIGVTKDAVNLFNSTTPAQPVFVIPTDDNLKVTIVYDVETYDSNVAGYLSDGAKKGSTVENKITKNISWTESATSKTQLEAGKKYNIKLHLGMTSVKFDATVADWGTDINIGDVDLPINSGN